MPRKDDAVLKKEMEVLKEKYNAEKKEIVKKLHAEYRQKQGKLKKEEKSRETRRSIIAMAYFKKKNENVIDNLKNDPEFDRYLTRNIDRELFGLPLLEDDSKKSEPESEPEPEQKIPENLPEESEPENAGKSGIFGWGKKS